MANAAQTTSKTIIRMRGWFRSTLGRVLRRGFFRIALLLFLIMIVLPLITLKLLANQSSGNTILSDFVVGAVFDEKVAEVTWDEDKTEFTGPSLALTGSITYHNLKVRRRAGATPHPRGYPLNYDFLTVPKVRVDYDLKRLPDLPITTVELEQGLEMYFNIHRGTWIDEDLFKSGSGEGGATPTLPKIITKGETVLHLRADGILVPPESLPAGADWYDLVMKDLSLLPDPRQPDQFVVNGDVRSSHFGHFELGGSVARQADTVELEFRSLETIKFDRDYAAVLAPSVRRSVEQFQIDAVASIQNGRLLIEPGKDLQFAVDVEATEGSICFVDFPIQVNDVSADIAVRNNNITVDAVGTRGGAKVRVNAKVESVGSSSEVLQVDVQIRDLLVDEDFRLALLPTRLQPDNLEDWETGMPYDESEWDPEVHAWVAGYPEWNGPPPWEGGTLYPDVADVLPFICRAFTPMGLADFELQLLQEVKGVDPVTDERNLDSDLKFKVYVRDATAAYTGLPETEGDGFSVPLHGVYGVVEGIQNATTPGRYIIRGYTPQELEKLGADSVKGFVAHDKKGLMGTLDSTGERLWVYAIYDMPRTPGEIATLRLEFESEGVVFDKDIKARMPEGVRAVVDDFAPAGAVDVQSATINVYPTDDRDLNYEFTLRAKNVAAQFQFPNANEPARFREVEGVINVSSEGGGEVVELNSLRGKLLDSPIAIDLTFSDGGLPSFAVESDDFEVKPGLADILPKELGESIKRFDPRGFVRFEVTGRRMENELDFTKADVEFLAGTGERSGSILFEGFPYPLTNVTGRFFVNVTEDWTEIIIRQFEGRGSKAQDGTEAAVINVNGYVLVPIEGGQPLQPGEDFGPDSGGDDNGEDDGAGSDEDGSEDPADVTDAGDINDPAEDDAPDEKVVDTTGLIFDLYLRATRVPVDSSLLNAMTRVVQEPEATERPALIQFIDDLNITGTVGTSGRLVSNEAGELDWVFEVILEGAGVNFVNFPYPLEGLFGSLIVDGYDVALRNVEGRAEEGSFTLHDATYTNESGWQLTISARDMSFHKTQKLKRALPQGLQDTLTKLNPVGEFDVDLELSGTDDFIHYDVSLDIHKTDIDLGLHFDDMTARFDMEGVFDGERSRQNGTVYIKEVFFKDARFNDVTTAVQYFDDRVEFPNLRGKFYDGWLEGRFGIEGSDYTGELEIRGANLKQLGDTAFPDAGELLGAMDAEVKFHSYVDKFGQIGRGRIDVQPYDRDSDDPERNTAKLAPVPLFDAIAAVTGSESNFDEGHLFFWLGEDRITIREMDFVSDGARVETFGGDLENYIMYDTAQMQMKLFFTLAPRSPIPLPLVQEVLDLLKQILFPLYVTGTLNDPSVEPFSLTADELDEEHFPRRPRGD